VIDGLRTTKRESFESSRSITWVLSFASFFLCVKAQEKRENRKWGGHSEAMVERAARATLIFFNDPTRG